MTVEGSWYPAASRQTLRQAAQLRAVIREWMQLSHILEVCTPALSYAGNTDPQVESIVVGACEDGRARYLHTSPEFAMKRILCAYPDTDIYQIAQVYRSEVRGRYHLSQFTMLEWYRVGMDHKDLMRDMQDLLQRVWSNFKLPFPIVEQRSYCAEVHKRLGKWPEDLTADVIQEYFSAHDRSFPEVLQDDLPASLDLFMDEFVVSEFAADGITFMDEYPAAQAALARTGFNAQGRLVAERFEVFAGSTELANGFHELADARDQRRRFINDQKLRDSKDQTMVPIDENLLAALQSGLPDCAGVALGLERLLMVLCGHAHIDEVVCFDDQHA